MTLITKSEELMAVSVRQGVELAAIEAKVLLGYLEGHDYSLMMDDKFHLTLHDNQDGENADNDQPYTIRDCIDFCQEMNSEHYNDPTPYEAHKNIRKEEQLEAARMRTISALVSALKQVADLAGFEIVGRVVLMDKDSGRIFR